MTIKFSYISSMKSNKTGKIDLDVKEIDAQIRENINRMGFSKLETGLELAKIKVDKNYKKLGYASMDAYVRKLAMDKGKSNSRIYSWLYMGVAYQNHKDDLEQIGFKESHGASKLIMLKKVLKNHEKSEVMKNIISMTVQDFKLLANGNKKQRIHRLSQGKRKNDDNKGKIFMGDDLAVIINPKIKGLPFDYLVRVNELAAEAIYKGEKIFYLSVKDMDEYEHFEGEFIRLIDRLRKKHIHKKG